jgi:hypothetical protein
MKNKKKEELNLLNKLKTKNDKKFFHTKYRPEFCEIAKEELSKMHSMIAVAARLKVCRTTLYTWMAERPEFNEAVQQGYAIGETLFEKAAIDNIGNRGFNAILWQMLGRRIYGYSETRLVEIPGLDKCKTYEEEINCVIKSISNGLLTPKEGMEMATIIATKAKTYEQVEAKKLLDDLAKMVDKK